MGKQSSRTEPSDEGKEQREGSDASPETQPGAWMLQGRTRYCEDLTLEPSSATYSRSKRSGRLKSHWMVEHCQSRPVAEKGREGMKERRRKGENEVTREGGKEGGSPYYTADTGMPAPPLAPAG